MTLSHRDGKWVPSTKFVAPYLLAVASNRPLPDLPDSATLADPAIELVQALPGPLARAIEEENQLRDQLTAKDEELDAQARAYEESLQAIQRARRRAARADRRQRRLVEALQAAKHAEATTTAQAGELALIKGSKLFRAARLYWGTLDRLAPSGSLRRSLYSRLAGTALPQPPPLAADALATGVSVVVPVPPLPTADEPEVSIVIPVYNNWALTAACLRSIADDVVSVPYEVIVVDDGSHDRTAVLLLEVGGISVLRSGRNRGYVNAVNSGIAAARGRFVVLLNNDTVVRPGWLDALVDRAEDDGDIGVVGAKLVHPDGRLQEAGGIVWRNGSAWNYGRGDDPDSPAYSFPRDVDYCSGACLLVRRESSMRSAAWTPATFPPTTRMSTSLSQRANWVTGSCTEPRSVVCHVEGATSGVDRVLRRQASA